jgi:hypothetical protein
LNMLFASLANSTNSSNMSFSVTTSFSVMFMASASVSHRAIVQQKNTFHETEPRLTDQSTRTEPKDASLWNFMNNSTERGCDRMAALHASEGWTLSWVTCRRVWVNFSNTVWTFNETVPQNSSTYNVQKQNICTKKQTTFWKRRAKNREGTKTFTTRQKHSIWSYNTLAYRGRRHLQ